MQKFKTNIRCTGCIQTVRPGLTRIRAVKSREVDLISAGRILTAEGEVGEDKILLALQAAGYYGLI